MRNTLIDLAVVIVLFPYAVGLAFGIAKVICGVGQWIKERLLALWRTIKAVNNSGSTH